MQESRYTKSKKSGFNVSSVYVLKSDMECSFPVDVVPISCPFYDVCNFLSIYAYIRYKHTTSGPDPMLIKRVYCI